MERWSRTREWRSYAPDGREVVVIREYDTWIVRCGGREARSRSLDVALIQAIRGNVDFVTHRSDIEYGSWTRRRADSIERDVECRNGS